MPKSLEEELETERFAAQFPMHVGRAISVARSHNITIKYLRLKAQWVVFVRGECAHINDLPKLIDMVLAGKLC